MQRFSFCQWNNITTENYGDETLPIYTSTLTTALNGLHRMQSSLILSKQQHQLIYRTAAAESFAFPTGWNYSTTYEVCQILKGDFYWLRISIRI
jgi:hypothetical protein